MAELKPRDHLIRVLVGVIDPGARVAGEVRVFTEDVLWGDKRGQLGEPARRADTNAQRIDRFDLVELAGGQETLAERGRAEIDDVNRKRPVAEPTGAQTGFIV